MVPGTGKMTQAITEATTEATLVVMPLTEATAEAAAEAPVVGPLPAAEASSGTAPATITPAPHSLMLPTGR